MIPWTVNYCEKVWFTGAMLCLCDYSALQGRKWQRHRAYFLIFFHLHAPPWGGKRDWWPAAIIHIPTCVCVHLHYQDKPERFCWERIFKCVVPYTNLNTIMGNQGARNTLFWSIAINSKITMFQDWKWKQNWNYFILGWLHNMLTTQSEHMPRNFVTHQELWFYTT